MEISSCEPLAKSMAINCIIAYQKPFSVSQKFLFPHRFINDGDFSLNNLTFPQPEGVGFLDSDCPFQLPYLRSNILMCLVLQLASQALVSMCPMVLSTMISQQVLGRQISIHPLERMNFLYNIL